MDDGPAGGQAQDPTQLANRLADVVNATSWASVRKMLEADSALLSMAADRVLAGWIDQVRSDAGAVALFDQYRDLLRRCREAGVAPTFDDQAAQLAQAGTAFYEAAEEHDGDDHLDRAIAALTDAVATVSPGAVSQAPWANALFLAYSRRYERRGDIEDLDRAIAVLQRACRAPEPGSPYLAALLNNLAVGLLDRFAASGNQQDLRAAIEVSRQAVGDAGESESRSAALSTLGRALLELSERTGDEDRVAEGLRCLREAAAHSRDDSLRAAIIGSLGNGLVANYERTGDIASLDAAADALREAMALTDEHSPEWAARQSNLGVALLYRYDRLGDIADAEAAITALERAAASCPPASPDLPAITTNLGLAIAERYERHHAAADLDGAIEAFEHALAQTPQNSLQLPSMLGNLGGGLVDRYHDRHDRADLDRALDCFKRALSVTPSLEWSQTAALRHNLGRALLDSYDLSTVPADLDRAVDSLQGAVDVTPADSPRLPGWLASLGFALARRQRMTGAETDRAAAAEAFRRACATGEAADTATALRGASDWAAWSITLSAWPQAVQAHSIELSALEKLVRLQVDRRHKETWLRDAGSLGPRAAYAASKAEDDLAAVLGLERCRAVLLSEALRRTPAELDALAVDGRRDLAERFRQAAGRLAALEGP